MAFARVTHCQHFLKNNKSPSFNQLKVKETIFILFTVVYKVITFALMFNFIQNLNNPSEVTVQFKLEMQRICSCI